jgi:tetratricopeptide (TPR) repeat protein
MSAWTADDFYSAGLTHSRLGQDAIAMGYYDQSLEINPLHICALSNKGYTLNLQEKYEDAIAIFNKAIEIEPSNSYLFSNRGLSKSKTIG